MKLPQVHAYTWLPGAGNIVKEQAAIYPIAVGAELQLSRLRSSSPSVIMPRTHSLEAHSCESGYWLIAENYTT